MSGRLRDAEALARRVTDHSWLPLKVSIGFRAIVRRQKLSNQPRFLCKFHLRSPRLRQRRHRNARDACGRPAADNRRGVRESRWQCQGLGCSTTANLRSYLICRPKVFASPTVPRLTMETCLFSSVVMWPFGILSARLTRVKAGSLRPGAKLAGKELLKLEQPLAVEKFEGIAVQQTSNGRMIIIVSDDNYSSFQQTLLLQFLLPRTPTLESLTRALPPR